MRAIIARYPVKNPRVFGSVARGDDREDSDIDIVVDAGQGVTYFDIARLQNELSDCLGHPVEVGLERALKPSVRQAAMPDFRSL